MEKRSNKLPSNNSKPNGVGINFRVAYDRIASEPELGRFTIQQNEIQLLLAILVKNRAVTHGLLRKKMFEKIERSTLGNTIEYYQLCAKRSIEEAKLLLDLIKYNTQYRNKLIHRLGFNVPSKSLAIAANKLGVGIKEKLFKIIDNDFSGR